MENLSELITQLQLCGVPLRQGEPLSRHTSFRIGGPAAVMTFPASAEQLRDILRLCRSFEIRPLILGAGTNVLAPDEGIDTLLIETRTGLTDLQNQGNGVLSAECGVLMSQLAAFAAEEGLSGLEFIHGIPGSIGGGVYMNAGAYGEELRGVVTSVTVMDYDGTETEFPCTALDFGYRHSRFMEEDCVILRIQVRLHPGDRDAVRTKTAELLARRKASQPLEFPSAGSTFKRPENGYAAALIEASGLKGFSVGGAQVSEKHAGFVINRGGASCSDVLSVMEEVQKRVHADSGIRLEPEVRLLEVKQG